MTKPLILLLVSHAFTLLAVAIRFFELEKPLVFLEYGRTPEGWIFVTVPYLLVFGTYVYREKMEKWLATVFTLATSLLYIFFAVFTATFAIGSPLKNAIFVNTAMYVALVVYIAYLFFLFRKMWWKK